MITWFRKKNNVPDIEFVDTTRRAYTYHPIELAKNTPSHFAQHQIEKYGSFKFAHCPGMADYKNYGYIITAWDDIHIMANKSGSLAHVGGGEDKRPTPFAQPRQMAKDIADGVFDPVGVPYEVIHIGSPWKIMVNNDAVSVLAMPAFFHSDFHDDLYVYPGIVDYGNFCEINFIFSPKRECNLTIKAGTPLLHVIPFNPQKISAGYGPPTEFQQDKSDSYISTAKQFYRKLASHNKPTTLESIDRE